MDSIRLNGAKMTSKEAAHEYLKEQFGFPDHYGKNLDALYDCLTERRDMEIVLVNAGKMIKNLQGYGARLLETFYDAAKEKESIVFSVKN